MKSKWFPIYYVYRQKAAGDGWMFVWSSFHLFLDSAGHGQQLPDSSATFCFVIANPNLTPPPTSASPFYYNLCELKS